MHSGYDEYDHDHGLVYCLFQSQGIFVLNVGQKVESLNVKQF